MRLYLKLLLLMVVFVCAAQRPLWRALSEVAYDVRVAYVCAFGHAVDMDRLVDKTQRDLANQEGSLDTYLRGKRFQQLLQGRLANATGRGIRLEESQIEAIWEQCQMEAFSRPPEPSRRRRPSTMPNIEMDGW
jgi:hypothetical protein